MELTLNTIGFTKKCSIALEDNGINFTVEVTNNKISYDGIVNAIVIVKYPSDRMQAVINNYLLDSEDEEIKREFQEMQAWRAFAKEKAKEALTEINTKWGNNTPTSNEEETN